MKILITGGTGFVGTQLTSSLIQDGYEVTILTRSIKKSDKISRRNFLFTRGPDIKKVLGRRRLKNHEAIINLAGASIFSKWTEEHKKAIQREPGQYHPEYR